ncbi:glycosyltransferase [Pedobacter frigoris]|uniref:glycosyltransferase n=1 Tax=Pedobacter frigoris TaxID=2571272 RepID=UPI00292D2FFF|nr:glycosyltransferase [Pedobacter frigoris]
MHSERGDRDYAIIVTAHQETAFIPDVVNSLLNINYRNFKVYVVADDCIHSKDLEFNDPRVIVIFPEYVLASNISSHFYAISRFERKHDVMLIMDSDNLADTELINELNVYFEKGFKAVQGVRNPKNLNSTIACLDAARDIYYHFFDGKLLFDLGSSATLSGSGMAFEVVLYQQCLQDVNLKGAGFDKLLQAKVLSLDERIAFSDKAIVLDQKTVNSKQLVNQRSRWIKTWFKFSKFGFSLILKGIKNFSINQILFGIILLRPPLFIFLGISLLLVLTNIFINLSLAFVIVISISIFTFSFFAALSNTQTDKKIYTALKYIPVFVFYQVVSLGKSFFLNKKNIATKHSQ